MTLPHVKSNHTAQPSRGASRFARLAVIAAVLMAAACSDTPTDMFGAAQLAVVQQPSSATHSAEPLRRQPIVQVTDGSGRPLKRAGVVVSASVIVGTAQITNANATSDSTGRAAFTALSLTGAPGTYTLSFSSGDVPASAATASISIEKPICANGGTILDLALGATERYRTADPNAPRCIEFHPGINAGQQYLVMFENMSRNGDFDSALFPSTSQTEFSFNLGINAAPDDVTLSANASAMRSSARARITSHTEKEPGRSWDFGDGPIYEGTPPAPPVGAPLSATRVSGPAGARMQLVSAVPNVGDTIQVYLAGIPRLGFADSVHRAVVRFVSPDLVFADDLRLTSTLRRPNGALNTPLTVAQMDTIAREYAAYARVQGDILFQNRHNTATEQSRVTVINTMTYSENIWGYTFAAGNYFAFDYWTGTDGRTRGNNQVLQRVADDLFMHEISHMRHYGMLERANPARVGKRGNQWLTEGFARFAERLPIAMRLTGSTNPSRTSNMVLARNPVFNTAFFMDDVPTYLEAGSPMFDGYAAASYIFDYLADHVALLGRDPLAAVRDMLVNGGVEADLNAAVSRWLPGMTFDELVTRARIALYADDYVPAAGSAGQLPASTQYLQYQLRASRPPEGTRQARDPRNAWPVIVPGATFMDSRPIANGGAFGYLIDGAAAGAAAKIAITAAAGDNGVVSITRIR